jgi:hypothetical protein
MASTINDPGVKIAAATAAEVMSLLCGEDAFLFAIGYLKDPQA